LQVIEIYSHQLLKYSITG